MSRPVGMRRDDHAPRFFRGALIAALGIAVLFFVFIATAPVEARTTRCGVRADVVKFLADKYKETRIGMGLINAGQMMELFMSEHGSWTMLITRPDGATCFGPVGKNWTHIKPNPVKRNAL